MFKKLINKCNIDLGSDQKNNSDDDMSKMDMELIHIAKAASEKARAYLSNYRVGAAAVGVSGKIYSGCNIEFSNYSNTIHAEEVAISDLIKSGENKLTTIAVFTYGKEVAFPCGMCLQSLYELGGKNLRVIACNENTSNIKTMDELMPNAFNFNKYLPVE